MYRIVTQPYNFQTGMSINVQINTLTGELFPFFYLHRVLYSTTNFLPTTQEINVSCVQDEVKYSFNGLPAETTRLMELKAHLDEHEPLFREMLNYVNAIPPHVIPKELLLEFTPPPYVFPTIEDILEYEDRTVRVVKQPTFEDGVAILSSCNNWVLVNNDTPTYTAIDYFAQVRPKEMQFLSWDDIESGPSLQLLNMEINKLRYPRCTTMLTALRRRREETTEVRQGLNNLQREVQVLAHESHTMDKSPEVLDVYTLRKLYMLDGQLIEPRVMQLGEFDIPYYLKSEIPEDAVKICHRFSESGALSYPDNTPYSLMVVRDKVDVTFEQRLHLEQRYPEWYRWLCYQTNQVPHVVLREG